MYTKHCMSLLEYAVPVWNGAITRYECKDKERVQKMALHILLSENDLNYGNALELAKGRLKKKDYLVTLIKRVGGYLAEITTS